MSHSRLAVIIILGAVCVFPSLALGQQSQTPRQKQAAAEYRLGDASWAEGRPAEALEHFRKVLKLVPDHVKAMVDAAWLLACVPEEEPIRDSREAVALARRATELTDKRDVAALDALAAALASSGAFEEAVATAEAALRLNPPGALEDAIRSRQEIYRRGYTYIVLDPR